MILGLGSDIVENQRIACLHEKYGEKFLKRLFTTEEIEYALSHKDPIPYLAARFAVKEAAVKALNLAGMASFGWKDVEVRGKIFGKKKLTFHNQAKELVQGMAANRYHVSLSHSDTLSMAVVLLEKV